MRVFLETQKGVTALDNATIRLADYLKDKGVTVSAVSKATNIPHGVLYPSFQKKRSFRADEFLLICGFLGVDPGAFSDSRSSEGAPA